MLSAYLDQNHWIELLKAEQKHPSGVALGPILEELRARRGVSAFFPVSSAHIVEMHKIANSSKRSSLGRLMFELSQGRTLLSHQALLPMEFDCALQSAFGIPRNCRSAPIFGFGLSHAFGFPPPQLYQPPAGVDLPEAVLEGIELARRLMIERAMFVDPRDSGDAAQFVAEARAGHSERAGAWVEAVEEERRLLETLGYDRGPRLELALAGRILAEMPGLFEAMDLAGIGPNQTESLGREGWLALLKSMPSSLVTLEMRRFIQSQSDRKWHPNDLPDLAALTIAIPYCDIVVTEKQWAHMAHSRGIAERFGTTVLSDLQELPAALDACSK